MESQVALPSAYIPANIAMHEPHWYVAYTYPRHEKTVSDLLVQKSIESFLPTFTKVSQWKDRRVSLEIPLFAGYVFVQIHPDEKTRVLSVPSIIRLLSNREGPIPVSDNEIDAVRLCIQHGANLQRHAFLATGDHVRVKSGSFEGLEGIVIRSSNSCRLVVSIGLIHQSVALEIDADLLELVSPFSGASSSGARGLVGVA
jgi:transcription antitermination factor NusG